MEKPSPSSNGSRELQCVGRLEIAQPKPVGFLCGSIPVTTDKAVHAFNSALVPSTESVRAPRYRLLPNETDLNTPPTLSSIPEKVLPIAAGQSRTSGDLPLESGAIMSNLTRKGEALAVSGFVEYGDGIDVIAPADILKQIFKIPYSKARLSVAVHRIGQTLVLNTGPDIEEGEKVIRRHKQSKCADQSLFLNFAMHSVRMEACDCPPAHHVPSEDVCGNTSFGSAQHSPQGHATQFVEQSEDIAQEEGITRDFPHVKKDNLFWRSKNNKKNKGRHSVKKDSQVKEKSRCSMQESDKYRRVGSEGFLRILFWQFHNFRMLLGSDLLLFSNEKYVAVSLHLWDVSRQVTPLTWLEAWLDNVMASVPELAICYHQEGVVQGYELLKTDDIFLLKGVSEDGTPAFHPHVVQQNGLSVLRFLQENCKQDPGAYWLYKSAGEDVIQLFDLSVIPKSCSSNVTDDTSSSLPSLIHRGRSDSLFSLGTLLYRIAHRLSLSMSPNNKARCARFFKKCIDFLDEPDHLVVRAFAHEQFARFLLNYDEELDLIPEVLPTKSGITVADAEEDSFDLLSSSSESIVRDIVYSPTLEDDHGNENETHQQSGSEAPLKENLESNIYAFSKLIASGDTEMADPGMQPSSNDGSFAVCEMSQTSAHEAETLADPISSKLAAIHHVSQAIKSLGWKRQLQSTESEFDDDRMAARLPSSMDFSVCACGDVDCIEVCDIREWLPTSKLDNKLWKLVLLLGESYLSLGQAYKDNNQLHQALKIVGLASLVYGSMPQHLEEMNFISSMVCRLPQKIEINQGKAPAAPYLGDATKLNSGCGDASLAAEERCSSTYLFWAKAWTLVGDVYVDFHVKDKEIDLGGESKPRTRELRMSSEVLKEVKRLKTKLGQFNQNCSLCSLVNCSCQSDRASSGSSASSSNGDNRPLGYGRKQSKRSYLKNVHYSLSESLEGDCVHNKVENGSLRHSITCNTSRDASDMMADVQGYKTSEAADFGRGEFSTELCNTESPLASQSEVTSRGAAKVKNGGIFKYLGGPVTGDAECILSAALSCYEEARKAVGGHPCGSVEIQSVLRKKGWVCNELGRKRLERKDLDKAELAFAEAINSFRQVSDHTNIILIYCNLGHGRRALAEEMVSKMETLRKHPIFHDAYNEALKTAKLEYSESLRYYGAAKAELNVVVEEADSVSGCLRNEVYTQFAHTYLRLGMLLAREDTTAQVYENGSLQNFSGPGIRRTKKDHRKHEASANEAIREALAIYESLGELRKQEAAYAYFQLACYQRDCCLKFLESDQKKSSPSKGDNILLQRVKQYASLAERNWQKSGDFYRPGTHAVMYMTILIERSALSLSLASSSHSNAMLESALGHLLEGRHVCEEKNSDSFKNENPELCAKFWSQLQTVLKRMLAVTLSASANKTSQSCQQNQSSSRCGDVGKLRELYKMSLKSTDLSQLHPMHCMWISQL
ncbi:hypothetical protein NMG60_11017511 [Bertholletia excelsa]